MSVYSGSDEDRFASISPSQLPSLDGCQHNTPLDQIPEGDHTRREFPTHKFADTSSAGTLMTTGHAQSLPNIGMDHLVTFAENGSTGQLVPPTGHVGDGAEEVGGVVNGFRGMPSGERGAARLSSSVPSSLCDQLRTSFKFNNLLDKCSVDDSEIVRPKPSVVQTTPTAISSSNSLGNVTTTCTNTTCTSGRKRSSSNLSDEFNRPRQVGVPLSGGNANGNIAPPLECSPFTSSTYHGSDETLKNESRPNEIPRSIHGSMSMPTMIPPPPLPEELQEGERVTLQSFLFPVSNSPLDLVTMLSRMAHFTGELLNILVPKASKTEFSLSGKVRTCRTYNVCLY